MRTTDPTNKLVYPTGRNNFAQTDVLSVARSLAASAAASASAFCRSAWGLFAIWATLSAAISRLSMSISSASYRGEMPHDSRPPLRRPPMCPAAAHLHVTAGWHCWLSLRAQSKSRQDQTMSRWSMLCKRTTSCQQRCSIAPQVQQRSHIRLADVFSLVSSGVVPACAKRRCKQRPNLALSTQYQGGGPVDTCFSSCHSTPKHDRRTACSCRAQRYKHVCRSSSNQHIRAAQGSAMASVKYT